MDGRVPKKDVHILSKCGNVDESGNVISNVIVFPLLLILREFTFFLSRQK